MSSVQTEDGNIEAVKDEPDQPPTEGPWDRKIADPTLPSTPHGSPFSTRHLNAVPPPLNRRGGGAVEENEDSPDAEEPEGGAKIQGGNAEAIASTQVAETCTGSPLADRLFTPRRDQDDAQDNPDDIGLSSDVLGSNWSESCFSSPLGHDFETIYYPTSPDTTDCESDPACGSGQKVATVRDGTPLRRTSSARRHLDFSAAMAGNDLYVPSWEDRED